MNPLRMFGWLLVLAGVALLVAGGISYTKEREAVQVGGVEIAAERKGFVSPVYGGIMLVAGALLIFGAGRRRK